MNDAVQAAQESASTVSARTLVIGPLPRRLVVPTSVAAQPLEAAEQLPVPASVGQLRVALAGFGEAAFAAVFITDWPREAMLPALVRTVRAVVGDGGHILFLARLAQGGWRGAVVGLFRRRRPVALEALCGALLSARLTDIRANCLAGSDSLVYGTVSPRLLDPVESSTVRPTA